MTNILEVPLEADGDVLTIDLDNELPEDPSEICVLLENEKSAAQYWLAFGSAYAERNQNKNAIEVVTQGLNAPVVQTEADKAPFYSSLCWLYLRELRSSPSAKRDELYEVAVQYGNKAFQLDRAGVPAVLARGALALARGRFDDSLQSFQTLLAKSQDSNIYASFGRARVLYHRRNYRGALALYQSILRAKPDSKPDPRIGIGLCLWKLGDKETAVKAWKRSLALDPKSVAANTLLGISSFDVALHTPLTQPEFEQTYTAAIEYMQDAYKLDPLSALPSLTIGSYLFSRQEHDSVLKLADRVLEYSTLPSLLSDAYFWRGRVLHLREQYDDALTAYRRASELDSNNVAAAVGRGIIEFKQDSAEALLTFEATTSAHPKNSMALLYTGLVYAKRAAGDSKRIERAIAVLERYVAARKIAREPPAPEALLVLSKLHEQTGVMPPTKALEYMEQAIASLVDHGNQDPSELSAALHNNRGVLAYFCNKYDESRASLNSARKAPDAEKFEPTLTFNLARLDDASGDPEAARAGYAAALEMEPGYVEARVRSAYLDIVVGNEEDGNNSVTKLMNLHGDNLEARALYGWYLRRQRRLGAAIAKNDDSETRLYKYSLTDVDKHDTYSLVAFGNVYLMNAREIKVSKDADAERKDKAYFKASEFFDKALQIDPNNAYAAQGIAIILAETKRTRNALTIFGRIRETMDDISVYVNTGHALMDLKEYDKAIEMYEHALNWSGKTDASIYALLGRAWYAKGATQRDISALTQSLEKSRDALEHQPENTALKFNVAFMQFQIADLVRRVPASERTLESISGAVEELRSAISSLRELAKGENPPFSPEDLEKRSELGEATILPQLERALDEQKSLESEMETRLNQARKLRQEEQERVEAERKRKRDEEELREQKLAEERKMLEEEAMRWEEERAASAAANAAVEPERKKRKADDFVDDDEEMADAPPSPESEPEAEPQEVTKSRRTVIDDDEDDEEQNGTAAAEDEGDIDDLF